MMIGVTGVTKEARVTETSKDGGGGGEYVTMAGQTNNEQQEKKELLSQWILEG